MLLFWVLCYIVISIHFHLAISYPCPLCLIEKKIHGVDNNNNIILTSIVHCDRNFAAISFSSHPRFSASFANQRSFHLYSLLRSMALATITCLYLWMETWHSRSIERIELTVSDQHVHNYRRAVRHCRPHCRYYHYTDHWCNLARMLPPILRCLNLNGCR